MIRTTANKLTEALRNIIKHNDIISGAQLGNYKQTTTIIAEKALAEYETKVDEDIGVETGVWIVDECVDKRKSDVVNNVGMSLFGVMSTKLAVQITSRHNKELEIIKARLRDS